MKEQREKAVSDEPGVMEFIEYGGASTQNHIVFNNELYNDKQGKSKKIEVTTIDDLVREYSSQVSPGIVNKLNFRVN